jgi:hypothetical protein
MTQQITTEWLESVGCYITGDLQAYLGEKSRVALDLRGHVFARFHVSLNCWMITATKHKFLLRVKSISMKGDINV